MPSIENVIFRSFRQGPIAPCAPPFWPDFCSVAVAPDRARGRLGRGPLRSMPRLKIGRILGVAKGLEDGNPTQGTPCPDRGWSAGSNHHLP